MIVKPVISSDSMGYIAPQRVTKAIESKIKLFIRNEDSLERIDCNGMALLSRLNRRKKMANGITVPIIKNVRNTQPRVEAANE